MLSKEPFDIDQNQGSLYFKTQPLKNYGGWSGGLAHVYKTYFFSGPMSVNWFVNNKKYS